MLSKSSKGICTNLQEICFQIVTENGPRDPRTPQNPIFHDREQADLGEIGKNNLGAFLFFPNLLLHLWGFLGFILSQNG